MDAALLESTCNYGVDREQCEWRYLGRNKVPSLPDMKELAEPEGDAAGYEADDRHFQAARPPGAGGDYALGGAHQEVGRHADDSRGDDGGHAVHEEEGEDRQ